MINQDRLVKGFLQLVQINSVSGKEQELRGFLKQELLKIGLLVQEDEAGNLVARLKGTINHAPTILFCAHMDTVEPGAGIEPKVVGNLISAKGDTILGADDKGGIAAIIEALEILKEEKMPHGNIEVLFTVEEEIGLKGAIQLETSLLSAKLGFVLDSDGPVGSIVTKGPYHSKVKVYIKGKAAHAGIAPEEGINAIEAASKALARLTLGRIDTETTVNIGIISGGKAINIIPDSVYLEGEVRSLKQQKLELELSKMEKIFNEECQKLSAEINFEAEDLYPGMNLEETDQVVNLAIQAVKSISLTPRIEATGGGSDAAILNSKGIPTVNLGLNMQKPHSTEEMINITDLIDMTRLVLSLIKEAPEFGQPTKAC